jgi:hypothetical protein
MKYEQYHMYGNSINDSWFADESKPVCDSLRDTKFGLYQNPIGIEIELENFLPIGSVDVYPLCWTFTDDTSLKVTGQEMISVPLSGRQIDLALHQYKLLLDIMEAGCPTTGHRCSIHVHLNIRSLTQPQLMMLLATYACVEQLFFSLVKDHRKGNSYCYPLTDLSPQCSNITEFNPDNKYCALNTAPVWTYGTVEFRHLHATTDIVELTRWLQLICKLYAYVEDTPVDVMKSRIMSLNSTSAYMEFVNHLFAPIDFLFKNSELQILMQDEVAWAKAFLEFNKKKVHTQLVKKGYVKKDINQIMEELQSQSSMFNAAVSSALANVHSSSETDF